MGKNITEILWTSTAKKDLREIFKYLVQFAEDAAFRVINKIVDKAELLRGDSPEIGQREPLLIHKPVVYRYLVEGNYKIIYSVRGNKVVIHTVFDARQNPEDEYMLHFLHWRFGDYLPKVDAGIITHPDSDRCRGFYALLNSESVFLKTLYHNGIVERAGTDRLGPKVRVGKNWYLADFISKEAALRQLLSDVNTIGRRLYPRLLKQALDSPRVWRVQGLSANDDWVPGFEQDKEVSIRILAPITESTNDGPRLRCFMSDSHTKNGHSIVLQVKYGNIRILLGGDQNRESPGLSIEFIYGFQF